MTGLLGCCCGKKEEDGNPCPCPSRFAGDWQVNWHVFKPIAIPKVIQSFPQPANWHASQPELAASTQVRTGIGFSALDAQTPFGSALPGFFPVALCPADTGQQPGTVFRSYPVSVYTKRDYARGPFGEFFSAENGIRVVAASASKDGVQYWGELDNVQGRCESQIYKLPSTPWQRLVIDGRETVSGLCSYPGEQAGLMGWVERHSPIAATFPWTFQYRPLPSAPSVPSGIRWQLVGLRPPFSPSTGGNYSFAMRRKPGSFSQWQVSFQLRLEFWPEINAARRWQYIVGYDIQGANSDQFVVRWFDIVDPRNWSVSVNGVLRDRSGLINITTIPFSLVVSGSELVL